WAVALQDDVAQYGFETISIDVGGDVPGTTPLSIGNAQNPDVEIVGHTNSTGLVVRGAGGRWMLQELTGASGPLPSTGEKPEAAIGGAIVGNTLTLGDEVGFRRMRETFHLANLIGDRDLMRTVWADDGLFVTGGGTRFEGGDVITDFFANTPAFGKRLVVTPESSQTLNIVGDTAEYAFECIAIEVGDNDPTSIDLCTAAGTQNPEVEIVFHTHSQGIARRVAEGHWVFQEFIGGGGPLPSED
ncbi:MAG: nuclear transport factor 2 family protein, partial [Planctomycetota bacterium]|nr:nuclear transport factor 2 family protein [Planctomycetota bacterium]